MKILADDIDKINEVLILNKVKSKLKKHGYKSISELPEAFTYLGDNGALTTIYIEDNKIIEEITSTGGEDKR